jgi:hypothetical protein
MLLEAAGFFFRSSQATSILSLRKPGGKRVQRNNAMNKYIAILLMVMSPEPPYLGRFRCFMANAGNPLGLAIQNQGF